MSKSQHPVARTIASELGRRIVDGRYPAGMALRQADIAAEFGVSHIPVREALSALAQSALVDIAPNRGATVVALSAAHCMELADMRVALETLALRDSAPRLGTADVERAREALALGERAASLDERAHWNWEFHRCLYGGAERPFLQAQLEALWRHADRYLQYAWQHGRYETKSDAEHRDILQAVVAKDLRRALAANRRHILAAARLTAQLIRAAG